MKKVFNFILAFYPIMSGYGLSPQADFGVMILFTIGVLYCVRKVLTLKILFPSGYAVFLVVALLLSIFFAHTIPLRLILYSANLLMACFLIEFETLKKYYGWIVFIDCLFFILQRGIALSTGSHISGIIPLVPTIYESRGVDMVSYQEQDIRFSSLFLEPSYFVQYLFPYIVLQLFSNLKHSFRNSVLVSLIMLLVGAGNGVILLMIIWGFWFFFSDIKLRMKIIIGMVGVLSVGIIWNIDESLFIGLLNRSVEFQSYEGDEIYQSSGFIRMFRGYYAYADMPFINKIFGANPQFADSIFRSNFWFAASDDVMINGTQTLLIYHGFISCFLFFRHLFLMFLNYQHKVMFVMMLCCIWLMLTESYFLCARMFLTTMLMYGMSISSITSVKCDCNLSAKYSKTA